MEDVLRDVGYAVIPCNWLQIMENSLDPVHVEWLHQNFYNYVVEQMGNGDGEISSIVGLTSGVTRARVTGVAVHARG
jgi:phenylpropionate dioxygenase-like ring-hydroxylating dioxygenase large terminal subunit